MRIQPETVVSVVRDGLQQPEVAPAVEQSTPASQQATAQQTQHAPDTQVEQPRIMTELIIEEISIDGMCGVY